MVREMRLKRLPAEYYLRNIIIYKIRIQSLTSELDAIRETCGGLKAITYDGISVQTSGEQSPLESAYLQAETQINRTAEIIRGLIEKRAKMIDQIYSIKPEEHANLLAMTFIDGKSPLQVMDKMNYSDSWYWHNRREALKTFQSMYGEEIESI